MTPSCFNHRYTRFRTLCYHRGTGLRGGCLKGQKQRQQQKSANQKHKPSFHQSSLPSLIYLKSTILRKSMNLLIALLQIYPKCLCFHSHLKSCWPYADAMKKKHAIYLFESTWKKTYTDRSFGKFYRSIPRRATYAKPLVTQTTPLLTYLAENARNRRRADTTVFRPRK